MRLMVRLAALLALFAFIPLSSQSASAFSNNESGRNTSSTLSQVGPRASFLVTSLADSGAGTLREAITNANLTPEADTITFQSGLTGTITLASNLPSITQPLTITGPGAADITITGASTLTAFGSTSGSFAVNISGLTLSGLAQGVATISKTLSLTDMVISGMTTRSVSTNGGSLNMTRVTITGNTGLRAVYPTNTTVTMTDSTISGNANIGMQISGGTVTITGTTFANNTTSSGAGAIYIHETVAASVTITDSTFANNTGNGAGAIYAANTTASPTTVNISNSTFSGNSATSSTNADAIYAYQNTTVDISFSTFSGHNNSTATSSTGIIYAGTNADVVLWASIIANNPAGGTPRECTAGIGATFTGSDNLTNDTICPGRIGAPTNVSATLADNDGPTHTHELLTGSNAIDAYTGAACPENDQRGLPRPAADTDCDLGAYEFGAVAVPVCPTSPAAIPAGDVAALIFAIECANASVSDDVINLTNSTYLLTATHNTLNGDNGLPQIVSAATAGTLIINGNGATISGNDERRVLFVGSGADITLSNLTISGGSTAFTGGGISSAGTLTLINSTVSGGAAGISGGGISSGGTLTLTDSTVSGNTASSNGGGIYSSGILILTGSTVSGNISTAGGGIHSDSGTVTLTGSTVSGNTTSGAGGGIAIFSGTVTLTDSTVSGNTASTGGGIRTSGGTLALTGSTVSGNTATSGGGISNFGALTLTNSTISGNIANNSSGGIGNTGTLTLNNSTVAGNTAVSSGDGIVNSGSGNVTLNNTILANSGEDCIINTGTVDANYTLFSNTSACGAVDGVDGNIVGADPLLGTLATAPNGTSYYPLNFASPAIDAGSDALIPSGVTTDQADNNRIRQARVDMGAFESDFKACPVLPATIPAGDAAALILAIECANASPSNDVINLTNSTYTLTATHNTLNSANGLPQIASAATAGTLTINGNGATISGNDERRVIYSLAGADLTLNNLTVSSGYIASFGGGGINNAGTLMLNDSAVFGNSASYGGGIYNTGSLTLNGSIVSGNTATGSGGGGGIFTGTSASTLNLISSTVSGNAATYFNNSNGGGIVAVGTVTLTDSTVSGNTANASGGGIFGNTTLMTLNNSTVSGNTANDTGGGIHNIGTVMLNNSTITGNEAVTIGGGFYNAGTVTLNNTILANHTTFDCVASGSSIAINAQHSLIEMQHSCGVVNGVDGNLVGLDPMLGTLATAPNGTAYYPLLAGSPAINSGSNALVPVGLDFDQAGNPRIQGGTVDMGSFETDTPAPAPEINVTGNGVGISDGDATPDLADHTDFGTTIVGTPVTRAFTIHNTSTSTLTIDSIVLPSGFAEAAPSPVLSVAAGSFTTLNVECEALSFGVYSGTITIESDDADENPYTFAITCQVDHAVPAGITITQTNGSTSVAEPDLTDVYTVALDRQPSADVTVTLTFGSQITANGNPSPVVLTFTPANWATAQDVTVTAVNDSLVEGAHSATISQSVSSADADYNVIELADISVTIADNDTAEVIFPASAANVSEDITPYSQNAVLSITSDPAGGSLAGAVTVQLTQTSVTALAPDDYTLWTASLSFPVGSINGALQSFNVNIVDDALEEPDETFVVGFGAITGPATATGTHTVTILANDAPVCPTSPVTIPAGDVPALIFAIECANASSSDDVIELTGNSTYTLTANHNTTNGPNGLPQIASAAAAGTLTINGNGAAIDGNDQRRVLSILSGANVILNNVSIANGLAGNGAGIRNYGTTTLNRSTIRDNTGTSDGGGIFNWGTLTIVNGTITGNTSAGWGGGIANGSGTLTLKNTTIAGNTAASGGGLSASGTVTVHNSILTANTATASPNPDCAGTVTASHSLFRIGSCGILNGSSGNIVGTGPGLTLVTSVDGSPAYYTINPSGIAVDAGDNALVPVGVTTDQPGNPRIQGIIVDMGSYEVYAPLCPVSGDTIPAGDVDMLIYAIECANASPSDETFELTNSTYALTEPYNFSLNGLPQINTTVASGTLTINGNGATISGSDTVRIFEVGSDADLTLNDMTLTNGRVTGINSGGAISVPSSSSKLTLNGVAINGSVAGNRGGAIYNFGEITVSDSVFSGNSATDGGAIYNARTATFTGSTITGNNASTGGGLYTTGASVMMTSSTVSGNLSTGNGGGFYIGDGSLTLQESNVSGNTSQSSGAGIYVNNVSSVNVYNSTMTDNTATVNGGAMFINSAGIDVWLLNSTIALNAASDGAGIFMNNGSLTVRNSIVATNESTTGVDEDCYRLAGTTNFSFNLFLNGACGVNHGNSGNIVGADPLLGTLTTAPNGTSYFPLLTGSPAINVGENALVPGELITDQAGNPRIQGGTVDMGAFETDTPAFVPEINVTGNSVDIASGDATPDLADHTDFGAMLVGAPVTRAFTIHNTGTGTLTIDSFTLPSGFVEVAPAPSIAIPAGGSTALNVQCEATWADTYSGTVTINTNDADESPYTFAITCQVDPLVPEINITGNGASIADGDTTPNLADHTDFGATPAGTPVTRIFTIENGGTGDLNLSGVALPSGFSIVSPPDPIVAAGGSTALNVQCDAATASIYFGAVSILSDDADESVYQFDIVCMVNGPEIEIFNGVENILSGDLTPSLTDGTDFGTTVTGTPVGQSFALLNTGNETLTLGTVNVPAGFSVVTQPSTTVLAGQSTNIAIQCDAATGGTFSGTVSLSTNDADENPFTFAITCEVSAPDINITGNGISITNGDVTPDLADHTDFGATTVGVPVTRTFTIENTGVGALNLTGFVGSPSGFTGAGSPPASTIPAGGSTTFSLVCDAYAGGTYSGTFGFTSNDPDESPYTFAITCQVDALTPDIRITGNGVTITNGDISPSLTDHTDFGATTVGVPVTRTYTIHNLGDADLHLTDLVLPSGFAPVLPGPSMMLAPGETTHFGLQCLAQAEGVVGGTVMIESDDPDTAAYTFAVTCEVNPGLPPDINITGNGVTIANGDMTPDLADHTDFGVTTVGVPVVRTFTIQNTGSGALNLTGVVGSFTGFTGAGDPPAFTIPAGGSTTFSLECEANAEGTYDGTFGFTSDDPDESPYIFAITCEVVSAPPAGITVTPTGGMTAVTEAGGTDTYTVELNSQPAADVAITLTFDSQITVNGSASPVILTFSNTTAQMITVAALNDSSVEGAHSSLITQTAASADAAYNAINPDDVTVAITDNDTATVGITLAPGSVFEGSPYFVNAVLSIVSDPVGGTLAAPVTVQIGHSENTALNPEDYDAPTASVTFPANSGHLALQLITTQTVDDAFDEPDETFALNFGAVTGPATASGTHTVTILDDDAAGVSVSETGGITTVTEAGDIDSFLVALNSQPTNEVTVTLTFGSQITVNGSASPLVLTFSEPTPQMMTVAAVNDSSVEGPHSAAISYSVASADSNYNGVTVTDTAVSITDNDTATIAFASLANANSEAVTPYQDNAVLLIQSDPVGGTLAAPVTVGLLQTPGTAATPDDYTLTTASLTFPAGAANAATQPFQIAIVNDALDESDENFTLGFGTVTGAATASGTHTVTILDDDAIGVSITQTDGATAVSEAGTTDAYTVVLNSQAVADVTMTLTFNSQITVNGQTSPVTLTFNAANWNVFQTITVAAVNDSLVEGAHSAAISYAVASADSNYNGFSLADTLVTVTDNDTASITFETAIGSAAEGTSPYTVSAVLNIVSDPAGGTLASPVEAQIVDTPNTAAMPADYTLATASITFPTGASGGAVQPISVAIVDDALPEGDETFELSFGAVDVPASGTHTVTILASDSGNLLQNPGFESAGTGVTKATSWTSAVLTKKDKRVCDTATKTFANSGSCAFRFQHSGILTVSRVVKQTVQNPVRGIIGENYTLDAMISASSLTPGAKLILQVKYRNGTKAKAVINVPSGSYGYTAVETALPITRNVTWVRAKLVGGTASGRLLIDDLVLWVEPGTPATDTRATDALLPPPPAPDGFRGSN